MLARGLKTALVVYSQILVTLRKNLKRKSPETCQRSADERVKFDVRCRTLFGKRKREEFEGAALGRYPTEYRARARAHSQARSANAKLTRVRAS